MTIQTFKKVETHIQAIKFDGTYDSAMEICKWVGSGSAYAAASKTYPIATVQIPTMFGPRDIEAGQWVGKIENETFLTYKEETLFAEYAVVEDEEQRLIQHARRELALFSGEDVDFMESIIDTIKGFCSYRGHSGGSASVAIHMVTALLNGQNLLPLTTDPEEWEFHAKETYGVPQDMWQNKRNSSAISYDAGATYFLAGETKDNEPTHIYTSEDKDFKPEIDPEDLKSDAEKDAELAEAVEGVKSEDDKAAEEALDEVKRIFDEAEDKSVE